jgi:hypothetical protein
MMPRHPRPGETREEYSAYLEEFKANPPTLPRPRRRRGGWSSGMVPWRNPPGGMSPLSNALGLGNLTDKLQALAKEGGVPRNEPGPDGGFFTGPLTKYIEPTPTDDLIPYPEDAGPDFPSREDIVARNESYEHWREADNQRRQGIMAANYFLGDMAPSELLRSYKERVNTPDAPVSMAYGGMPPPSPNIRPEQQGMLGRRPRHPALNTGNRQPPPNWPGRQPQGWPGQQPGFNLQEATGALDTAQGLLGDASSEITAADMEPLSNARGMVSQAQHVLSRGFGPPRQQNPWGGRGGISGAQQVAGVGSLAGLLGGPLNSSGGIGPPIHTAGPIVMAPVQAPSSGGPLSQPTPKHSGGYPKTPQDLGPQGIAPPMLPAFMANGGPAETTGIGPLYMQGGGDASLTFDAGDTLGLAASVAANLGAFGKLGAAVSPIGAAIAIANAIRTGNPWDVLPMNLGNVIYQKFFESDEARRDRTAPPKWGQLPSTKVIREPLEAVKWVNPDDKWVNPDDPDYSGPGAGGFGSMGGVSDTGPHGHGDEEGLGYAGGGLATLL